MQAHERERTSSSLLTVKQVCERTTLGRTSIYERLREDETFPKPVPFGPASVPCGGAQATSTIGSRRCRARTRRPRGGPGAASADQAVDGACHDGSGPAPAAVRSHPSPAPATGCPRPGCRAARAPSPLPNPADGAGPRPGVQGAPRLQRTAHVAHPTSSVYLITSQAKRNLSSRSGIGGVLSAT